MTKLQLLLTTTICIIVIIPAQRIPDDKYCEKNFEISSETIMKVSATEKNSFIASHNQVRDAKECELYCCNVDQCNVAVYEDRGNRTCYLFDCGNGDDFTCSFTSHDNYIAMGLTIDRIEFDKGRAHDQNRHEFQLRNFGTPKTRTNNGLTEADIPKQRRGPMNRQNYNNDNRYNNNRNTIQCTQYQWACFSGDECVAQYDVCTGYAQCPDGSDEDEGMCRERKRQQMQKQSRNRQRPNSYNNKPEQSSRKTSVNTLENMHTSKDGESVGSTDIMGGRSNNKPMTTIEDITSTNSTLQQAHDAILKVSSSSGSSPLLIVLIVCVIVLACTLTCIMCRARRRSSGGGRNRRSTFKPLQTDEDDMLMDGLYKG